MIIRVGEYMPDIPALENPGALEALNVVPLSPVSYGPWPTPVEVSTNALDTRAQGLFAAADYQANIFIFAADDGKLYRYTGSTFADVSKIGGYATAAGYASEYSRTWRFEQFNNLAVATNSTDAIQVWTLGTSSVFADLAATAPKGRYLATVGDFLVVGHTTDSFDGEVALRIWWSPIGSPTTNDWGNTNLQSDLRTLPAGIRITGIAGGEYGVIFCQSSIYRMTYSGPPTIFSIDEIAINHGCISPGSLAQTKDRIFYLAEDGFQMMVGFESVAIGQNKVDETFFSDLVSSEINRIVSTVDTTRKLYIVAYPGDGSTAGLPNKVLLYNYQLDRWARAENSLELLGQVASGSLTLEDLGAIYTNTDDVPGITDSAQWSGGVDFLACFSSTHKLCSFTGPNAAFAVDTSEQALGVTDKVTLRKVRPLTDVDAVTVKIGHRNFQNSAPTFTTAVSPHPETGLCTFREKARYHRARIEAAQGWMGSEIFGVDGVEFMKAGRR